MHTQHTQRQKLSTNLKSGYKSSSSSGSDSSYDRSMRKSTAVLQQVDSCIQELEKASQSPGMDMGSKIKSKGGGGGGGFQQKL